MRNVPVYEDVDLSKFKVPVLSLSELCNKHSSTLQRQIHKACEEAEDYVMTNVKIGKFSFGQPKMMITSECAAELVAASRQWSAQKSSDEVAKLIASL